MTISAAPPPHLTSYAKNMIATPAPPPSLSPPHPLRRFTRLVRSDLLFFLEMWHHFHHDDFLEGGRDDGTKGEQGACVEVLLPSPSR